MNIFFLSYSPIQCAEWYVDAHVNKLIIELAQITEWVRGSRGNFVWASQLMIALGTERLYRWPNRREHRSSNLVTTALNHCDVIPAGPLSAIPLAMPRTFIHPSLTAIESHRAYYAAAKCHLHKWTRRERPPFIIPD